MEGTFLYRINKNIISESGDIGSVKVDMLIASPNEKEAEIIAIKKVVAIAVDDLKLSNYRIVDLTSKRDTTIRIVDVTLRF